jgi:hypothetical protein
VKVEQIVARLLEEIETNQAKADVSLKEIKEEMLAKMEKTKNG